VEPHQGSTAAVAAEVVPEVVKIARELTAETAALMAVVPDPVVVKMVAEQAAVVEQVLREQMEQVETMDQMELQVLTLADSGSQAFKQVRELTVLVVPEVTAVVAAVAREERSVSTVTVPVAAVAAVAARLELQELVVEVADLLMPSIYIKMEQTEISFSQI
jgi:hypothetical protein